MLHTLTAAPHLMGAAAIAALDLSMVSQRLAKQGWDQQRIEQATGDYRVYLQEIAAGGRVEPTPDVDEVWHAHILHTRRYAEDCDRMFGAFLHHDPAADQAALCVPSIEKALCVPSVDKALCVPSVGDAAVVH